MLPATLSDDLQDACDAALEGGDEGLRAPCAMRPSSPPLWPRSTPRRAWRHACANDAVAAAAERGILA